MADNAGHVTKSGKKRVSLWMSRRRERRCKPSSGFMAPRPR